MKKKNAITAITAAVAALVLVGPLAPASAHGSSTPAGSIVDVAVAASGGGTHDNNPYD